MRPRLSKGLTGCRATVLLFMCLPCRSGQVITVSSVSAPQSKGQISILSGKLCSQHRSLCLKPREPLPPLACLYCFPSAVLNEELKLFACVCVCVSALFVYKRRRCSRVPVVDSVESLPIKVVFVFLARLVKRLRICRHSEANKIKMTAGRDTECPSFLKVKARVCYETAIITLTMLII